MTIESNLYLCLISNFSKKLYLQEDFMVEEKLLRLKELIPVVAKELSDCQLSLIATFVADSEIKLRLAIVNAAFCQVKCQLSLDL